MDGGEAKDGAILVRAALVGAQLSLYLSEHPQVEGGADSTMRSYLEGAARISCVGGYFDITTKYGSFKSDEIMLGGATDAQNIFSGHVGDIPSSIYFIPAGWRTHSWCCVKCGPKAKIGKLEIGFFEKEETIEAENGAGSVKVKFGSCAKIRLGNGPKGSAISGKGELEIEEMLVAPSADFGTGRREPCILVKKPSSKGFRLLTLKDKPDVEITQERLPAQKPPVDEKNVLVVSQAEFTDSLSIYYYAAKDGDARIGLYDVFGLLRYTVMSGKTFAGGHEAKLDGERVVPGFYRLKYFLDERLIAETDVTKKLEFAARKMPL